MVLQAADAATHGGVKSVDTTHTGATNEKKGALGRGGGNVSKGGVLSTTFAHRSHTRAVEQSPMGSDGAGRHRGGNMTNSMQGGFVESSRAKARHRNLGGSAKCPGTTGVAEGAIGQ